MNITGEMVHVQLLSQLPEIIVRVESHLHMARHTFLAFLEGEHYVIAPFD